MCFDLTLKWNTNPRVARKAERSGIVNISHRSPVCQRPEPIPGSGRPRSQSPSKQTLLDIFLTVIFFSRHLSSHWPLFLSLKHAHCTWKGADFLILNVTHKIEVHAMFCFQTVEKCPDWPETWFSTTVVMFMSAYFRGLPGPQASADPAKKAAKAGRQLRPAMPVLKRPPWLSARGPFYSE